MDERAMAELISDVAWHLDHVCPYLELPWPPRLLTETDLETLTRSVERVLGVDLSVSRWAGAGPSTPTATLATVKPPNGPNAPETPL